MKTKASKYTKEAIQRKEAWEAENKRLAKLEIRRLQRRIRRLAAGVMDPEIRAIENKRLKAEIVRLKAGGVFFGPASLRPACKDCGEANLEYLIWGVDPFDYEMNGGTEDVWLCQFCFSSSAEDI